jgi:hypothetical protein
LCAELIVCASPSIRVSFLDLSHSVHSNSQDPYLKYPGMPSCQLITIQGPLHCSKRSTHRQEQDPQDSRYIRSQEILRQMIEVHPHNQLNQTKSQIRAQVLLNCLKLHHPKVSTAALVRISFPLSLALPLLLLLTLDTLPVVDGQTIFPLFLPRPPSFVPLSTNSSKEKATNYLLLQCIGVNRPFLVQWLLDYIKGRVDQDAFRGNFVFRAIISVEPMQCLPRQQCFQCSIIYFILTTDQ